LVATDSTLGKTHIRILLNADAFKVASVSAHFASDWSAQD
jgi:hypothetical protein